MKKAKLMTAAASLLSLAALASCNSSPDASVGKDSSGADSVQSSQEETEDIEKDQLGFYLPDHAPHDYVGADIIDHADGEGAKEAFLLADHKMINSDYSSECTGTVEVKMAGVSLMRQSVSSFNVKVGENSLNQAVTAPGSASEKAAQSYSLASATVTYENPSLPSYRMRQTSKASAFEIYDGDKYKINWDEDDEWENLLNLQQYMNKTGKHAYSFSSYYVPDTTAISTAELISSSGDENTFKFTFNVDPSKGVDAAKYYVNQMKNMTSSIPNFSVTVNSLEMTMVVDSEWNVKSIETVEKYDASAFGISGATVSTVLRTDFTQLASGIDSISDEYQKTVFQEAISSAAASVGA